MSTERTMCRAVTKAGRPCPRQAVGGPTCAIHAPGAASSLGSRGGRPSKQKKGVQVPASPPTGSRVAGAVTTELGFEPDLTTAEGINATLHQTALALARGQITAAGAGAMVRLANVALESLDTKLRDDLEAVEEVLRKTNPNLMPRKR